jgi:hypothetical protein
LMKLKMSQVLIVLFGSLVVICVYKLFIWELVDVYTVSCHFAEQVSLCKN